MTQYEAQKTLGLRPGELAVESGVAEEDVKAMKNILMRLVTESGLLCCAWVRNFGSEVVLQFGTERPFSVEISSDLCQVPVEGSWNPRVQGFESALIAEFTRRLSK